MTGATRVTPVSDLFTWLGLLSRGRLFQAGIGAAQHVLDFSDRLVAGFNTKVEDHRQQQTAEGEEDIRRSHCIYRRLWRNQVGGSGEYGQDHGPEDPADAADAIS